MQPLIVYLVDDDPEVLVATERLLLSAGLTVAAFQSARAFLEHYDTAMPPGCLVLDLAMPELNGPQLQRTLTERNAPLPIVFVTGRGDIRACAQAMKDGAVDFLAKPVDGADLLNAVNQALARAAALQTEHAARGRAERALAALTPRERQVLVQVVAGRLNKQIAADLGTGEKTVKYHRGNLMKKLGVRSVPQLVRLAQRAGITSEG